MLLVDYYLTGRSGIARLVSVPLIKRQKTAALGEATKMEMAEESKAKEKD
jgi:hypothetical protein